MSHALLFQAAASSHAAANTLSPKPSLPVPRPHPLRLLAKPAVAVPKLRRRSLAVRAQFGAAELENDSVSLFERCLAAPAASGTPDSPPSPVMKGQYGAHGAVTLEKSKLDTSQKQTKSSPEVCVLCYVFFVFLFFCYVRKLGLRTLSWSWLMLDRDICLHWELEMNREVLISSYCLAILCCFLRRWKFELISLHDIVTIWCFILLSVFCIWCFIDLIFRVIFHCGRWKVWFLELCYGSFMGLESEGVDWFWVWNDLVNWIEYNWCGGIWFVESKRKLMWIFSWSIMHKTGVALDLAPSS